MKKLLIAIILFTVFKAGAQDNNIKGMFNGSLESYTQYYLKDTAINSVFPQDRIGSNNYLKLDYNYKNISAGVQFEAYLPTLAGFPFYQQGSKIVNKYFTYSQKKFSITAGDFYEQFGSGLIYRSWENRQIGINNALEGIRVTASPLSFLNLKAIYGRQRKVFDYTQSIIRGADAEFDFSKISSAERKTSVIAGFNVVSRYQEYTGPQDDFPATVTAASARININSEDFSFGTEYTYKSRDPHNMNVGDNTSGKALLVNFSYAKNNFGLNLNLRSMENMDFRSERELTGSLGFVNYIPALTKQHEFLTTNIYVYNPQSLGETGGQLELFYNFNEGSFLGGKHGSKLSLHFSHFRGLKTRDDIFSFGNTEYFHDFNLEWKKKWSNSWTTNLLYQNVFYNKQVIEGGLIDAIRTNTVVLNTIYKYATKKSVRFELQHLATKQDHKSWAAALTEFTFAPSWSFYVSDLYNYGDTKIHYYNVGGNYSKGGTRFGLSYGRTRPGLLCVGGVCRFVPAATGITATLTTSFHN